MCSIISSPFLQLSWWWWWWWGGGGGGDGDGMIIVMRDTSWFTIAFSPSMRSRSHWFISSEEMVRSMMRRPAKDLGVWWWWSIIMRWSWWLWWWWYHDHNGYGSSLFVGLEMWLIWDLCQTNDDNIWKWGFPMKSSLQRMLRFWLKVKKVKSFVAHLSGVRGYET